MPETVYRVMTLLSTLVVTLPVGTNLGVLHLLWMLVSGRLLAARGAVIPGLSESGLPDRAVRRAWAALGQGAGRPPGCWRAGRGWSGTRGTGSRWRTGAIGRWRST